jgi:iron complex outermembrane recepter protein
MNVFTPRGVRLLCLAAAMSATTSGLRAQEAGHSLADLSIEELMNESVTSVAKKETRLGDAPAAISVITQEDIRRSGYTSLPELLRLVPGLNVARIDNNEWAISSRGFNNQFATDLLVLIDGRTIYTPASAGVFWNAQDVVLEDIDRIEVIRGPGATLWGANAVNGVINIITKSARDTQGGLIAADVGNQDTPATSLRYGGQSDSAVYYRVYTRYFNRDAMQNAAGPTADEWSGLRAGFRTDWQGSARDAVTLQGEYYGSDAGKAVNRLSLVAPFVEPEDVVEHNSGGNVLGRWTRTFSPTSQLTAQSYYDRVNQGDGFGMEHRNTYDFDLQHSLALGSRQSVVWGIGYRYATIENTPSFNLTWTPESIRMRLFESFVQDDITIVHDRLRVIAGSKLEHNNLSGGAVEPSLRLLWTPAERSTFWAGVSRATRTPSLFERDPRLNVAVFQPAPSSPPVLISEFGNPHAQNETLVAYEAGSRFEPTQRLSFDLAVFYNDYRDLLAPGSDPPQFELTPAPPHVLIASTFQNGQAARTYGAELAMQWRAADNWRLATSYTELRMHARPDPTIDSQSPEEQTQLRSYIDLPRHLELNGSLAYVSSITEPAGATSVRVPAYLRMDLGIGCHPTDALEMSLWGQNLLHERHLEFASQETELLTEIPRSVLARVTWRF